METRILTLILVLVLAGAAGADESRVPDVNRGEIAEIEAGERAADDPVAGVSLLPAGTDRTLSPMHREIRELLLAHDLELEALNAELAAAPNERAALKIQRKIAEAKQAVEPGVLGIQLRFARERGDSEAVDRLETALRKLEEPVVRAQPQARPAPPAQR